MQPWPIASVFGQGEAMRQIAAVAAACIAISSAYSAQAISPISLYKDEHWLLHLHERDPLPFCMLMAAPLANGEPLRRLVVYVDGTANIARIEVNYPPQQYLAPNRPTTVVVNLGPAFTRSIKFRLLLHSSYPIIAARLSLSELEDIRLALDEAIGDVSVRFENGEIWRFPPRQDRKLATAAAACGKSAVLTDSPPGQDDDVMRCERHLSGCADAVPVVQPTIGEFLMKLGRFYISAAYLQYLFSRGNEYLGKDRYDQAIEYYDRIIQIDPGFEKVFNQRGIAHLRSGRYDHAFRDFDQASRLKPTFATAFGNRGLVYNQRGEYGRAIRDFDRAIRFDPKNWQTFRGRGIAKKATGDIVGGDADLDTALRLRFTRP